MEGRPKTRSGEDRRVDLGERSVAALLARRLAQDIDRSRWGTGYVAGSRVFTREDGADLSPDLVTKTLQRLIETSGLRPIRLHDLRHGAASLMLASGADIALVPKRLGHSSVSITVDTYSHLLEGVGRRMPPKRCCRLA